MVRFLCHLQIFSVLLLALVPTWGGEPACGAGPDRACCCRPAEVVFTCCAQPDAEPLAHACPCHLEDGSETPPATLPHLSVSPDPHRTLLAWLPAEDFRLFRTSEPLFSRLPSIGNPRPSPYLPLLQQWRC